MTKFPPYLNTGDQIGIVAPAGFMPFEKMESCVNTIQDWGYTVRLGATTHSHSINYFSGSDEERLQDLQEMLDNPEIRAVLCARGGYGMSRIIDSLNFKKFRKKPKWIVGFSDITVLQAHIYSRYKISSLHAPMAAAFNEGGAEGPYIESLRSALEGKTLSYKSSPHPLNREGRAKGELVGGNLALIVHLIGTSSGFKTKNKILFLEDTGEYLYNIDRMMLQLKRSGKLEKLEGFVAGGFTDIKDTERPFGRTAREIIAGHLSEYDYPVCFDFPVSHGKENYTLKIGAIHSLQVSNDLVELGEVQ